MDTPLKELIEESGVKDLFEIQNLQAKSDEAVYLDIWSLTNSEDLKPNL